MTLVEKIKTLCDEQGTTLIGLERKIGLGRGTIRNWDTNSPSIHKLEKVADHFSVSVDYLLERESNKLSAKTLKVAKEIDLLSDDKFEALKKLISTMIDINK
ncbi:helix-turn-helix transcriptional regulator [Vallitalea pronyensis]|uniref:Helix-turn-helix transcriptional regulator n=1 Tax=Vallitalea pronyensis TaxID=1348613 RepID=A0A8J8MNW5_9FIRM|nr:helix-turn-helix transcriptional regulator [Vallitalea pronyensis]QUI24904.1 helix-turn-helix transcriptional regulator [Vallitalea pronyensis]